MTEIIIIGGGAIGLMTARELLLSGLRVRVLERQTAGREASWAGGGILSPLCPWRADDAIVRLFLWSHAAYPDLANRLREDTGADPEWIRSGLLVADCDDPQFAENWCINHGLPFEFPNIDRYRELEPALGPQPVRPIYLPAIAQVRNPRLVQALRADVRQRGGQLLENREVTAVTVSAGKVARVVAGQEAFEADAFVLTTGAWSGAFVRRLMPPSEVKVEPVKGQMILFAAEPGLLRHIVIHGDRYLIPRKDGRILAGSTVEHTGFNKDTTRSARAELETMARTLLPALAACPVEHHWAGLRPGSPQGIPYIAKHPEIQNLYVNCGHFRNGLVMAPASTRLLADLLLDRPPCVGPKPYGFETEH